jgi:hypothetical protein
MGQEYNQRAFPVHTPSILHGVLLGGACSLWPCWNSLLWLIALSTQPKVLIFSWKEFLCIPGQRFKHEVVLVFVQAGWAYKLPHFTSLLLGHEIERFIAHASTHLNRLIHKIVNILTLLCSLFYNCENTQQNNPIQHIWSSGYSNFGYRCTRKLFCFQLGFSHLQIDSVAH